MVGKKTTLKVLRKELHARHVTAIRTTELAQVKEARCASCVFSRCASYPSSAACQFVAGAQCAVVFHKLLP